MFKKKPDPTEPAVPKKVKGVVSLAEARSVVAAAEANSAAEAAQQEADKIATIRALGWIYSGTRGDGYHVAKKRINQSLVERVGVDLDKLLYLVQSWEERV